MSRSLACVLLVVAGIMEFTPHVSADWIELTPGVANYHNLVGNAEAVTGGGPLLSISGNIAPAGIVAATSLDFDVYRINIVSPATFSASTASLPPGVGVLSDTALFLFTATGVGIATNDDLSTSLRSSLPAGNPLYASLPAGEYLLAIAGYDHDPIDSASLPIFPDTPFTGVNGPIAGRGPLAGQDGSTSALGTYRIDLTGAAVVTTEAVAVPEPASLILLGVGAVGAFGYRRRRNPQAS